METVLLLKLQRLPYQGNRSGDRYRYTYQVLQDGKVIATRDSKREYVAAYVMKDWRDFRVKGNVKPYALPYMFGAVDRIGKGDSRHVEPYAVAVLEEYADSMPMTKVVELETDRGTITIIGLDPDEYHFGG